MIYLYDVEFHIFDSLAPESLPPLQNERSDVWLPEYAVCLVGF